MGIGSFIRKFNDNDCSCDVMEQLGSDVPYYPVGRPVYSVIFSDHFMTEVYQALTYDVDTFNTRRFKMSSVEYDFWLKFQGHEVIGTPADYAGNLDIAVNDLDKHLHRDVQNLDHVTATKLYPDVCSATFYDNIVIPTDINPSVPVAPSVPPVVSDEAYLVNGSRWLTASFQAGGHPLSNVAEGVADDDAATIGQVEGTLDESLERGTYGE